MSKRYVLYNPKSNNGGGEADARRLDNIMKNVELTYTNVLEIADMDSFFKGLDSEDSVVLCGGDGSLNYFINHVDTDSLKNEVIYFPCGTGNDFFTDVKENDEMTTVSLNKYLKNLPTAIVNGKEYKFLNNVGFGIDGYCCQVGDEMRANHVENINYTSIAIKGLLGKFKPVTATVTVDGKTEVFRKAWLAPTMNGRYYGGGMMATPGQDRLRTDGKVSVLLFYGKGKLPTLVAFPSIFKGEHVKKTDMVKVIEGSSVKVSFDRPCALQIDGETFLNITSYEVKTNAK